VKRFSIFWAPVFLYAGIIFYFSSLPQTSLPPIGSYDKIIHTFEFLVLGFLLSRGFNSDIKIGFLKVFVLASVFNLFYGISDEVHQLFTPGREFSFGDILADGIGGILGSIGYLLLKTKMRFIHINRCSN